MGKYKKEVQLTTILYSHSNMTCTWLKLGDNF